VLSGVFSITENGTIYFDESGDLTELFRIPSMGPGGNRAQKNGASFQERRFSNSQ